MNGRNQQVLLEILDDLYSTYNTGNFYLITNQKESAVRSSILEELKKRGNKIDIDIYIFTSQIDNDVMIKL